MGIYSEDLIELRSILSYELEHFKRNDTRVYAGDLAFENITADIDDDYLSGRAEYYKEHLINSPYLIAIETKYCRNNICYKCPVNKYCNSYIINKIENYNENSPKIVDLFCGAGGLSLGFTQEGFITSLANDIEPCCVNTYAHNHPETPRKYILLGDINEILNNAQEKLRFKDVDVVVGGPPCQGFSMANRQRIIDDPRNRLYKSYINVVSQIQPKYFVMENVKGMLPVSNQVMEDFEAIGYTVSCKVFNASDFGVPQNRERLIFIGNRLGVDNNVIIEKIVAESNQIKSHVLADALLGLRPLKASRIRNSTSTETDESGRTIEYCQYLETNEYINTINMGRKTNYVFNHKARYNNDRDIEIYGRLYQGDKSDDPKIADIMPYTSRNGIFKDKYFKLEEKKVCKTITAHMKFDCNMYIHPTQARGLTPREAARVQSFPDDYFFRGAYTKTYMQIGNSVPPLLGRAIARVLKAQLEEV